MSIENDTDLRGLLKIGHIVAETLAEMEAAARPGITTRELDEVAAKVLRGYGARPAPLITYGFPGVACISINDEAAHGIPGERVVQPGDLVKFDVSAELGGYFADAATTVCVPPVSEEKRRLIECARSALADALAAACAGQPINGIGRAAEARARKCGYRIVRDLPGHGVGRKLHEAPDVPSHFMPNKKDRLTAGLVITVEPHISSSSSTLVGSDGWTLRTRDRSLAANFEHTIVVTSRNPIIITAS